eukprot:30611_1
MRVVHHGTASTSIYNSDGQITEPETAYESIYLRNAKSKLSNKKHTRQKYHYKPDCSYFKPFCKSCCVLFVFLISALGITSVIIVSGYYVTLIGIEKSEYADSFVYQGYCQVIDVSVTTKTCKSGGGRSGSSVEYDCSYTTVTVENYNGNINGKKNPLPCDGIHKQSYKYDSDYYASLFYKGLAVVCWTNSKCDELLLNKTDTAKYDHASNGIYFGASVLFLTAMCYCGCVCYFCGFKTDKYKDCKEKYCKFITGIKNEHRKNQFYKYEWNDVMDHDDRFDYVMSYWMRNYCQNGYHCINDGGICYDIESLIYDYLTK